MGTKFYKAQDSSIYIYGFGQKVIKKMLIIFSLLLTAYISGYSQTNLSFTQIPVGNADLVAPGRGAEYWNNAPWDNNNDPQIPAGNSNPLNSYYRFNWVDIESTTAQGSYDWSIFDNQINSAIDKGEMFSFGVMSMCSGCGLPGFGYPTYLHNLMQSEATNSTDWQNSDGVWVPNWNSPNFQNRWAALLNTIANHINTTSHNGKAYKNAIYYVDVRGYGDFGEWHTYPWTGTEPTGRLATTASLEGIIGAVKTAFPNNPLVIAMAAFAPNTYDVGGNISSEFAYYVLTTTNAWGQIGWRRDNLGDDGYNALLANNDGSYNPGSGNVAFQPLIMNKWKYAPIGGEPANDLNGTSRCGSIQCDLVNEVNLFHISSFGNGNYPVSNSSNASLAPNVIAASKASGYRLVLTGGNMTTNLSGGSAFNITVNWQNIGVAPVYEKWNVVYELRKSDGTVVWTGNSAFQPSLFLPQPAATPQSDNFTLTSVTPGTYSMYLIVRDPVNYKTPLPLAITGRNTDGSYLLRSNITVGTGTGNLAPTASPGANQTIQLPTSSVTLAGTGSDPDGTISTYAWAKVSGPAGGTIATPNTANTSITGLAQGVYSFSLTVTDNQGAIGTANVQVTVNAATTPPSGPFVVNAGPDQTLAAGITATTLTGTIPASTPTGSPADTANLIVIWGESNAAGNADNSSALPSELASRSTVQIFNHNTGAFENLQIGVNNEQDGGIDATHHGLELGLANEVDAGRLRNPTYLVKIGASGSYMCQWLTEYGTTCRPTGNLWDGFIPLVDGAVAKMKAMGKPFRIIVWQSIGLNDEYSVNTLPADFVTMSATFRADFRARFGANIPFLATDFNNPPTQTYAWTTLFTQMAVSDRLFFSIPVTGATYVDAGVHFDYAGFKLIAHNMVTTMLSLGEGVSSGGGAGSTYTPTWTKVSGPTGGAIATPTTASTNLSGLTAGTFTYRLSVTDNLGSTVTDDVQVTVNAATAPVNQPPLAKAGSDLSITLPTSSAILNGSSSSDPDGSISAYLWTKLSGPSQFTIGNNTAASTVANNLTAGVYSFQLKVTDNLGATALDTVNITVNAAPVNQPPVANAGSDITITLPTNLTNLVGTASNDPDGSITTYAWSQISGPSTASIVSPANASTGISGLVQGVYVFSLNVTDNAGATNADNVTVTVNPAVNVPPVANAGVSKSITLPVNTATLDGSLSSDADGTIASFAWAQISGPSTSSLTGANTATATAASLLAGQYTFELTVTDNSGAISKARVKITVIPVSGGTQPPVANAGADQTITLPANSVTIDGSASVAPSGNIVSYVWTEKSGPSSVGLSNTAQNTISNLKAGVYVFLLTVTDNNSGTGTDSVIITVNSAANLPPVANPGASISLTLPTNTTFLDGTKSYDPDGTIKTYSWTQVSGPNTPTIIGANTATLNLGGLIVGQYTFQLTVTDNNGASSSAQVKVIVTAAGNILPIANAGPDQTITSPASSVILNGSASSDPDGTIKSYSWVTVSGPGAITINNSNTVTPSAVGLQIGQYVFELTVTDNSGATAKDQVIVNVLPPAVLPNQAPVANAGSNLTITAPENSISLNGTNSFDPDGTITGYSWTQVSGPSAAVISLGNTSTPAVSQLIVGQYVFQLKVTDNNGASGNDQVTVTVNPAVSKVDLPPVANAGPSDSISLPNNTFMLNASQSTDPDGTITNYQWQQIGGPNTASSSSMNSPQVTVSGLQSGQYEFQVTVTDNEGATATATMKLMVEAPRDSSAVADQFFVFPNPAHDVTRGKITSSVTGKVKINVYDMNGRLVLATEVQKTDNVVYKTLSVSSLAPGMYTVQVNIANRKTMVTKFIKN